uniref:ANK_REP_REGION domain-containing protein n=1 Tax=Globodera pallida TaxID=36090 RepID=A0A183BW21_GLOPA
MAKDAKDVKSPSKSMSFGQRHGKGTGLRGRLLDSKVGDDELMVKDDPFEVIDFRPDLLASHKIVWPEDTGGSMPSLIVVQGSIKNEQSMALNHVVYTVEGESGQKRTFSISGHKFSKKRWTFAGGMKNAVCFFGHERASVVAHGAHRVDIFMDDGLAYLQQFEYSVNDVVHVACSPEALMLAIQTNQESIVRFLLKHGADLCTRDPMGNNAIQLRVVNPLCMKTLFNFGGELLYKSTDKNLLFELIQSNKGSAPEKSPSLLNERDITNGNTCLHAVNQKTSLLSLLHLKHKEMDLNAKNKSGFTPLHQFVIREDIGLCSISSFIFSF